MVGLGCGGLLCQALGGVYREVCADTDIRVQAVGTLLLSQHDTQSLGNSSVSSLFQSLPPVLILAGCRAEQIFLANSELGDSLTVRRTATFLGELVPSVGESSDLAEEVKWGQSAEGIHITHSKPVRQFCWHCRGDYIAAVTADGKGRGDSFH